MRPSGAAAAALVIYGALVIVSSQLRRTCHEVSRTHSAFVCNLSSCPLLMLWTAPPPAR